MATPKGTRWGAELAHELDLSNFGVVCLTRENVNAPWLNFEAGSLAKSVERGRVSPLLIGLKKAEVTSPWTQFQLTDFAKEDTRRMVRDINAATEVPLEERRLDKAFAAFWPQLEQQISPIAEAATTQVIAEPQEASATISRMIEEILGIVRDQQILLNEPAALLPRAYLQSALSTLPLNSVARRGIRDFITAYAQLKGLSENYTDTPDLVAKIKTIVIQLDAAANTLSRYASTSGGNDPWVDDAARRLRAIHIERSIIQEPQTSSAMSNSFDPDDIPF